MIARNKPSPCAGDRTYVPYFRPEPPESGPCSRFLPYVFARLGLPALYGYARVSTLEQDLRVQRSALKAAGCEVIRAEKASGTRRDGRTELQVLLAFLRPGDALVVTRIDRLARSLREKRVALRATEQPIDTGTAVGKAFLDMLGVFAEFETNLRKERQAEGIAAAKARGVYKGRKPNIDPAVVHKLRHKEKLGPAAIARRLGIGRASVYRVLGKKAA